MAWVALGVAAIGAYGKTQEAKAKSNGAASMMPTIGMDTEAKSVNAIFDNSGWNVAFPGATIESSAEKSQNASGPTVPISPSLGATTIGAQPAAVGLAGIDNQTLIYAGLGLALLLAWKRKNSA